MRDNSKDDAFRDSPVDDSLDPIIPIDFTPPTAKKDGFKFRLSALHVFVAVFLAITGTAAWFVLTASSVYVQTNPATATIDVDSGFSVPLGQRYLMRPGTYQLTLRNEGYHDAPVILNVTEDAAQIHPFDLRPKPGLLSFEVQAGGSVSGARVMLDNIDLGVTPLTQVEVEPGEYEMVVSLDRYQPWQETIIVNGRLEEQAFSAVLQPAWAELSFETEPPGADVIVSGELLGTTPLQAQVLQGAHEVTLKLAGHKAWQDDLVVTAGEDMLLPSVSLERADGLVFIRSVPGNANVTINGDFKGQTPLEVALAPGREHQITLFRTGFNNAQRNVRTNPDEEQYITIALVPVTSMVKIQAQPADAELYIDGEFRGEANQTVELLSASQRVEIRKQGFVPYATTFTSRPGLEQQIRVNLKSLEEAKLESIKPVITTVAGQTLKLFYPGEFTMGASRREPGRRANETLRDVALEKPFYLSLHEVTNGQFRRFRADHSSGVLQGSTQDLDSQPVVQITWTDAALYSNWLSEQESLTPFYQVSGDEIVGYNADSTGYRLPTEAEWEWAARTDDAGNTLRFPWGEQLPPPDKAGNFADLSTRTFLGQYLTAYDDGVPGTAPVGGFTVNARGLFDMSGNVSEWVHDYYGAVGTLSSVKEVDPLGPDEGSFRTIKGSSWAHSAITELRLSYRDFGEEARDDLGFRIARYLGE